MSDETYVIGTRNAGFVIIEAVTSRNGDMYVTGYDEQRGHAVTWATWHGDGKWFFCWGQYFTASTDIHNQQVALGNMYKRAGFVL